MKLVAQVRVFPTAEEATALEATVRTCNTAANQVSRIALGQRIFHRQQLQHRVYAQLKAAGLSAQPALHVIRKVADAYTSSPDNRQTCRAFRWDAAQPFDDRCLSWQFDQQTVSIWTVHGRMKHLRFGCSPAQLALLRQYRKGETDLVYRDGLWLLIATCEVPDPVVQPHRGCSGWTWGSSTSPPPAAASGIPASG